MLVLYGAIIAALLGATALCTDVAVMYVNSIQVQKGADSAAIMGANYLNYLPLGRTFTNPATGCAGKPDDAEKAACTYAANNGIAVDANLTITEPTSSTVKVAAQRINLPYYFGKVIGLSTYAVAATSVGQAPLAIQTVPNGMFPVGLQCNKPCKLSNMNPGQSVSFGQKFAGGLAPGNWQWLAVGGTGDSILGTNVGQGITGKFSIGDQIQSEPGKNNSNNVRNGLADRGSKCEALTDPCGAITKNPTTIPPDDPCLVIVPAVDWHGCTGSCSGPSFTIEGFALIYLELTGPNASTGTQINGCFVSEYVHNSISSITAIQLGAQNGPTLIQ